MRTWLVAATFITLMMSPMLTNSYTLEESEEQIYNSSSIQTTISPSSGSISGGDQITISGTGFSNLSYHNLSEDGLSHSWTTSVVDYVQGGYGDQAIATTSNGDIHIVYWNYDTHQLKHAVYDGTSWTRSVIVAPGGSTDYRDVEMVVDSNDHLHVSHWVTGDFLHYRYYNGTGWSIPYTTSNADSYGTGIAVDSQNHAHIVFSSPDYVCGGLMLAYDDGTSWSKIGLDTSTDLIGCYPSIDIDSNDAVHVAYRDHRNSRFNYITNESGPWDKYQHSNTNTPGYYTQTKVQSDGDIFIIQKNSQGLRYAEGYPGSAWSQGGITGDSNDDTSLFLDGLDRPHILHWKSSSDDLMYSTRSSSGSWSTSTVDGGPDDVGRSNALVIDADHQLHAAYADYNNKQLKYATMSTGLVSSSEVSIQFGAHGTVTGTVVDDSTIVVDSPAGLSAGPAALTLIDADGISHNLNVNFTYIDPNDSDSDGVANAGDDCPNTAGTSSIDLVGCPDSDGDGYSDSGDNCPSVSGTSSIGELGCLDADGDGYSDSTDAFPNDSSEWLDADGDGVGDNADAFPNDATETVDTDGDGVGDNSDWAPTDASESADSDGDGVGDNTDAFPNDATETVDTDGDGVGDNSDWAPTDASESADSDGDGVGDNADAFPLDATETVDSDGDGIGDNSDPFPNDPAEGSDSDGDGVGDNADAFPNDPNETVDTDGDGVGDNSDWAPNDASESADSDGDGVGDNADAFPNNPLETMDSDGDGIGDNSDAFPNDPLETRDLDGDGVGDNADAFPLDATETVDSDNDGVGDNSDAFPNNPLESADSDGDGIGDNVDPFPYLNNFADTDLDGYLDILDAFPYDPTQWLDTDGDGYGDNQNGTNPDAFITIASQWSDLDGDGYGDNWGDSNWNTSRSSAAPGVFINGATLPDYCPEIAGTSIVNGFYGCVDANNDGIADVLESSNGGQNGTIGDVDSDFDGIINSLDKCPNTPIDAIVDIDGCEIDLGDLNGNDNDDDGFMESFFSGEGETTTNIIGISAILLAIFALLQTNAIAGLLPETFRWVQVLRRNNNLTREEKNELTYLQSVVQAYYSEPTTLQNELKTLRGDLTARYTNNEIKKETREKLLVLIDDIMSSDHEQLLDIAYNDAYFGLMGTLDVAERTDLLEEELSVRQLDNPQILQVPDRLLHGEINKDDGFEYLEHPGGSGNWWYRKSASGDAWQTWEK